MRSVVWGLDGVDGFNGWVMDVEEGELSVKRSDEGERKERILRVLSRLDSRILERLCCCC